MAKKTPTVLFLTLSSSSSHEKTIPFIVESKKLGFHTIVFCNKSDEELLVGDENHTFEVEDFSGLISKVMQRKPDLIVTQNSRLTPIVGFLSQNLGLPLFNERAAKTLCHKDLLADLTNKIFPFKLDSFVPHSVECFEQARVYCRGLILKPTFSTGGINTHIFNSPDKLFSDLDNKNIRDSYDNTPLDMNAILSINSDPNSLSQFMIQEFVPHTRQIGLEVFVFQGKVHVIYAAEIKTCANRIHAISHIGYSSFPSEITTHLQKVIDELGIQFAYLSPDILIDDQNRFYLIDANLNVGGEGLLESMNLAGYNLARESISSYFSGTWSQPDLSKCKIISSASPSFANPENRVVARLPVEEVPLLTNPNP